MPKQPKQPLDEAADSTQERAPDKLDCLPDSTTGPTAQADIASSILRKQTLVEAISEEDHTCSKKSADESLFAWSSKS